MDHESEVPKAADYALRKAAIEVELFPSYERHTDASVSGILYPTASSFEECIEEQLNSGRPNLVHKFKMVELPRIPGIFYFSLWKLVCGLCREVRKLGSGRLSCPPLFENILVQLMNLPYEFLWGLQSFCTEDRIKLSKIDHMFLSRVCSETADGLPGLLLILAGIGDEGLSLWGCSPDWMELLIMIHKRKMADSIVLIDDEVVKMLANLLQPVSASESRQNHNELYNLQM
ncbi:hypothetical protein POM88_038506 [Heracleum sosnowskyi]|uniref:Uncharacterized protein n=1 Tax=Heracleum sosnowskyi TaxID=360622 RepID=A0AAD8H8M3_9APIA|nr:hypothetical protein POM88_038506 [Heracleum sosnowskyi]